MNTKTVKTILFAALFAAMILPAGMQSVYAEDGEHGTGDQGTPDGTNQTDESDGSHQPIDVIPDGTNQTDESDGTNVPEGTEIDGSHGTGDQGTPDGTNVPTAEQPDIEQP